MQADVLLYNIPKVFIYHVAKLVHITRTQDIKDHVLAENL